MNKGKILQVILAISTLVLVFSIGVSAQDEITTTSLDDAVVTAVEDRSISYDEMVVTTQEVSTTKSNEDHFGDILKIKQDVNGSSLYAGSTVTIDSNISGILMVLGQTIKVNGTHEYGAVAGATLNFNATIDKDLFMAGSDIVFGDSAKVGRDTYVGASTIEIQGTFGRDVVAYAGVVVIDNAVISGDIKIDAEDITIGDNVTINGTLNISETATKDISDKAIVGEVTFFKSEFATQETVDPLTQVMDMLMAIANYIVLFIVIAFLFPNFFQAIANKIKDNKFSNYMEYGGIGFIVLFAVPIFAIISLISIAGMGLGFMVLGLYVTLLMTSTIVTGYVVGETLVPKVLKNIKHPITLGIFGITLLYIVNQIPYINGITGMATMLIALGLIFKVIVAQRKQ